MLEDSKLLDRWLKFELDAVNRSIVPHQKSLKQLLKEAQPSCQTKDGESYYFDTAMLIKFAKAIPNYKHDDLMLPINLYFDLETKDHCYISDELAASILRQFEKFENAYRFRNGKMWLPYSVGMQLLMKYKTIIQRIFVL